MTFLLLFLFSTILLGSFDIGPFSVRVYMTVLMIFSLLLFKKKSSLRVEHIYIYIYAIFLILMALALVLNGDFYEFHYFKILLAYHIVAVVCYYALFSNITNELQLHNVNKLLLVIMTLTSIATILQYFNTSIGWFLSTFLSTSALDVAVQDGIDSSFGSKTMLGNSNCIGIFGFAFANAMYIAATSVIAFRYIFDPKYPKKVKIFCSALAVLGFITCFMTQQRMVFYFQVLSYLLIVYKSSNHKLVLYLGTALMLLYLTLIGFSVDADKLGRMGTVDFESDSRIIIWTNCIDFISTHLLLGGPVEYHRVAFADPHNFFLSAFIYAGLFGGLVIIYFFFKVVYACVKNILSGSAEKDSYIYSYVILIYFSGGMAHNENLVAGSSISFIFIALMLIAKQFENKQNTISTT